MEAAAHTTQTGRHFPRALEVAGRAYAQGRLEVSEVAVLFEMTVSDAVALLEEHGYGRPVEGVRLPDEERARILAEIDADRRRRGGRPSPSSAMVTREVVATQRIEGVDARPWLPQRVP